MKKFCNRGAGYERSTLAGHPDTVPAIHNCLPFHHYDKSQMRTGHRILKSEQKKTIHRTIVSPISGIRSGIKHL